MNEWPLFANPAIDRSLPLDARREVLQVNHQIIRDCDARSLTCACHGIMRHGRSIDSTPTTHSTQSLVASGHAEWKDEARTTCFVMWRSPQEIAASLLDFVRKNGMAGQVYTVYDLHSGDELTATADFHGTDPAIFRRALDILEGQGKCAVFRGQNSEEDGVKFVADA